MERITSSQNPLLRHIRKLQTSRAYREEQREFVADGFKLLEEALKWYPKLKTVVVSETQTAPPLPDGVRCVRIPESLMQSLSDMKTPQGVIFTCGLPERKSAQVSAGMLLLNRIQDPGNLGTILRTADAFGVPVAVTALTPQASDIREVNLKDYLVVIGSEGQGVCKELLAASQKQLIIPMQPRCESLNAAIAAAIVMWQMK